MKKTIKDILFDAQIANAQTAKKEQLLVISMMMIFAVVLFVVHVYAGN